MLAQHLVAEGAVEALDVGVLVGLAGLDVLDCHGVGLRPLHEGFAQELRAMSVRSTCGSPGRAGVARRRGPGGWT